MPKSRYRLPAFSLVLVLFFQVFIPVPLLAEPRTADLQEPQVTLEQAIKIVKENFEITENLKEFTSGFSSYNSRKSGPLSGTPRAKEMKAFPPGWMQLPEKS
jgi:hypothetical protein